MVHEISSTPTGRDVDEARCGVIFGPDDGRRMSLGNAWARSLTSGRSNLPPTLEFTIPSGFQISAHLHERGEESIFVLEGVIDVFAFVPEDTRGRWQDWTSHAGDRVRRASAGSMVIIPQGCPHALGNSGSKSARFLMQSTVPGHEQYFLELGEVLRGDEGDPGRIDELRRRYSIVPIEPAPS